MQQHYKNQNVQCKFKVSLRLHLWPPPFHTSSTRKKKDSQQPRQALSSHFMFSGGNLSSVSLEGDSEGAHHTSTPLTGSVTVSPHPHLPGAIHLPLPKHCFPPSRGKRPTPQAYPRLVKNKIKSKVSHCSMGPGNLRQQSVRRGTSQQGPGGPHGRRPHPAIAGCPLKCSRP